MLDRGVQVAARRRSRRGWPSAPRCDPAARRASPRPARTIRTSRRAPRAPRPPAAASGSGHGQLIEHAGQRRGHRGMRVHDGSGTVAAVDAEVQLQLGGGGTRPVHVSAVEVDDGDLVLVELAAAPRRSASSRRVSPRGPRCCRRFRSPAPLRRACAPRRRRPRAQPRALHSLTPRDANMNSSSLSSSSGANWVSDDLPDLDQPQLRNVPLQARSRERVRRILDAADELLAEEGAGGVHHQPDRPPRRHPGRLGLPLFP